MFRIRDILIRIRIRGSRPLTNGSRAFLIFLLITFTSFSKIKNHKEDTKQYLWLMDPDLTEPTDSDPEHCCYCKMRNILCSWGKILKSWQSKKAEKSPETASSPDTFLTELHNRRQHWNKENRLKLRTALERRQFLMWRIQRSNRDEWRENIYSCWRRKKRKEWQ